MKPQLSQRKAARTTRELRALLNYLLIDLFKPIKECEWDMIEHTIYYGTMPNNEDRKLYIEMNTEDSDAE